MKRARGFRALVLLAISIALPAASHAAAMGKFTRTEGTVDLLRAGKLPAAAAKVGDGVTTGDFVRTKSASTAEITFNDGNLLRVGQRSRIDISEYVSGSRGMINLPRGKVEASVAKAAEGATKRMFEIRTPNAVAGVRGTEFFVTYDKNVTKILVKSGTVYTFSRAFPKVIVPVPAGTMTTVAHNSVPQNPKPFSQGELNHVEREFTGAGEGQGQGQGESQGQGQGQGQGQTGATTTTSETVGGETVTSMSTQGSGGDTVTSFEVPTTPTTPDNPPEPPKPPEIPKPVITPPPPPPPITEPRTDTAKPEITLTEAPPKVGPREAPYFEYVSNEPVHPVIATDFMDPVVIAEAEMGGPLDFIPEPPDGLHRLTLIATDLTGNQTHTTYDWFTGSRGYYVSGNIGNSAIFGSVNSTSEGIRETVTGSPLGAWQIAYSGSMTSRPSSATLTAGGRGDFGEGNGSPYGIWRSTIDAEFGSGGAIEGTSSMRWVSLDRMGSGSGDVDGTYVAPPLSGSEGGTTNASLGTWEMTDTGVGTLNEVELQFASEIYDGYANETGEVNAILAGAAGSTLNLWNATQTRLPITVAGQISGGLSTPRLWGSEIRSQTFADGEQTSFLTYALKGADGGGAYKGFIAGITDTAGTDGVLSAIYAAPGSGTSPGAAGFIVGDFAGGSTAPGGVFIADGGVTTVPLPLAIADASTFDPFTITDIDTTAGDSYLNINGDLSAYEGKMTSIVSSDGTYGVAEFSSTGWVPATVASTYTAELSASSPSTVMEGVLTGSATTDAKLKGTAYGYFATTGPDVPNTGIFVGETVGTFDASRWQAKTISRWIETKRYLEMVDNQDAALERLKMPRFTVATVDNLSGNDTYDTNMGTFSVGLKKVHFISSIDTHSRPTIWASGDAWGIFTFAPAGSGQDPTKFLTRENLTSQEVGLFDGNSLRATFRVTDWDESAKKWKGVIYNGNGSIGSETYLQNLNFRGGAAGSISITGTDSGTLTGTAAGLVLNQTPAAAAALAKNAVAATARIKNAITTAVTGRKK